MNHSWFGNQGAGPFQIGITRNNSHEDTCSGLGWNCRIQRAKNWSIQGQDVLSRLKHDNLKFDYKTTKPRTHRGEASPDSNPQITRNDIK